MAKFIVFLLIIFLSILSLLAFFNKESVNLTIWQGVTFKDIPIIGLVFISTAVGVISMLALTAVRDARRFIENWQIQRKHKKEAKILDAYSKGLEAFFVSRYDEAKELFARVIENEPAHVNSLLRLGDISLNEQDFIKAEEFYLRAREIRPKSVEIMLSLEKAAELQKKWQDAIKYLDDILDIDDENIKILCRKRDIYERNRKWEDLLDVQNKILKCKLPAKLEREENRKLTGYKYELGIHYLKSGSMDKAMKIFKTVIRADKDFIAAYLALSDEYLKEGDNKEAQNILQKGYEATSSMVFLVKLEDFFIEMGEPGTIIDIYQNAVQNNPKDIRLQFFLAKLYYRLEMIDYALDTINAIDISAYDYPDLHALLGSVYERRSEHEKAVQEFKKALQVDKPIVVPFCCSKCSFMANDWSGRCPECKSWNTFVLDINEVCKIQKRQSSS